jgi:F-type H+-transporting ATPase subunit epsilon
MNLAIATPEKVVFEGEILSLFVPGTEGYFQILENHAPLLSTLQAGQVTLITPTHAKIIYTISGGFFEVARNQAILLVDSCQIT